MAQYDTVTFESNHASFSAFTYEMPPLQLPKSHVIPASM